VIPEAFEFQYTADSNHLGRRLRLAQDFEHAKMPGGASGSFHPFCQSLGKLRLDLLEVFVPRVMVCLQLANHGRFGNQAWKIVEFRMESIRGELVKQLMPASDNKCRSWTGIIESLFVRAPHGKGNGTSSPDVPFQIVGLGSGVTLAEAIAYHPAAR
jgi:hypothetical protein